MSHIYRKQRAETHRSREDNSLKLNSSAVDKTTSTISQEKYQKQNVDAQVSVPLDYYFNGTEKKKIIKNLIDSYFQTNPQHTVRRIKKSQMSSFLSDNSRFLTPYAEKAKQFKNVQRNVSFNPNPPKLGLKDMSKTVGMSFFSNLSNISQVSNNLPIIDEIVDDKEPRRPNSEQKARYVSSPLTLKRRQSAGYVHTKEVVDLNNNLSSFSGSNNPLEEAESLSQSFVLSNKTTLFSRTSTLTAKSYSKQCKYYTFSYSKDSVIKSFNPTGLFLMAKEVRLKKYGAKTLWNTLPHLTHQLILEPHQPLNKQLYSKVSKLHGDKTVQIIYPHEPAYNGLFENNSEWLRDIIVQICRQLVEIKNKIIINKLTLDNITRVGQKKIRVIDWSAAGMKQCVTNLDKVSMVKITQPTLSQPSDKKVDPNVIRWICQPEYLSPEMIRLLHFKCLDDSSLWDHPSSSDMWSLGCLIFEILTLIPLNANDRHTIKGRNYNRRGLFYMKQFSYLQLERKQRHFCTEAIRILKKQCGELVQKVDKRVIQVMVRMLHLDGSSRIKPQQVISLLSK